MKRLAAVYFVCGLLTSQAVSQEPANPEPPPGDRLERVRNAEPAFMVRADVNRKLRRYAAGDELKITAVSEVDGYLYALYKQGAEGDVSGPKPGFFDFVGTAKYEAWAKLAGTSQEEAMQKYVDLVKKLLA